VEPVIFLTAKKTATAKMGPIVITIFAWPLLARKILIAWEEENAGSQNAWYPFVKKIMEAVMQMPPAKKAWKKECVLVTRDLRAMALSVCRKIIPKTFH
jgi:hypothetical protein